MTTKLHLSNVRMKHIDVHFHFVQQAVDNKHILVKYIPTNKMVADILTKSLSHIKFKMFWELLNVI